MIHSFVVCSYGSVSSETIMPLSRQEPPHGNTARKCESDAPTRNGSGRVEEGGHEWEFSFDIDSWRPLPPMPGSLGRYERSRQPGSRRQPPRVGGGRSCGDRFLSTTNRGPFRKRSFWRPAVGILSRRFHSWSMTSWLDDWTCRPFSAVSVSDGRIGRAAMQSDCTN
jgi:hypothetical protein